MKLTFDEGAALVTGGTGGIGSAVVRRLVEAGVPVGWTYHSDEAGAKSRVAELETRGKVAAYRWGSPSFEEARGLLERVQQDLGPVRFLVLASGIGQQSALHTLEEREAHRLIEINLTQAVAVVRPVATAMMKHGAGRIVLIGSVSGSRGLKGHTVYAATKAGLEGLTRSLAQEAGPFGVTVNCVAPGFIDTPMIAEVPEAQRTRWKRRIPLGRLGEADDVAALVCFVLSNQASYVTGQTLIVDGGISL